MSATTGVGAKVLRKEDFRFITGKGQYTDDVNRAGQAHAYFLRSPLAHATINKLDTSAAKNMPGVVGVLTGDDLAALARMHGRQLEVYRADVEAAKQLVRVGASPHEAALDPAEHAALASVCLAILNLDEALTRE